MIRRAEVPTPDLQSGGNVRRWKLVVEPQEGIVGACWIVRGHCNCLVAPGRFDGVICKTVEQLLYKVRLAID